MRSKTIRIKTVDQGLNDFVGTYKRSLIGRSSGKKGGTFFSSIDAARKVLTGQRIRLLRTIKQKKPSSIYELAKLTSRDFKNVSEDIGFLATLGLVELGKSHGVRKQRKPTLVSDHIYVELSI